MKVITACPLALEHCVHGAHVSLAAAAAAAATAATATCPWEPRQPAVIAALAVARRLPPQTRLSSMNVALTVEGSSLKQLGAERRLEKPFCVAAHIKKQQQQQRPTNS